MSNSWRGGSSRRWRTLRLFVLERDGWTCQLCHQPIDPTLPGGGRNPHPMSATVHHTKGKQYGDNPDHLVAAHRKCNLEIGDPNKTDPQPITITKW